MLVVYAGPNERNELAVEGNADNVKYLQGSVLKAQNKGGFTVFQYNTTTDRQVAEIGNLRMYFLGKPITHQMQATAVTRTDFLTF